MNQKKKKQERKIKCITLAFGFFSMITGNQYALGNRPRKVVAIASNCICDLLCMCVFAKGARVRALNRKRKVGRYAQVHYDWMRQIRR